MRNRQWMFVPVSLMVLMTAACSSQVAGQPAAVVIGPTTAAAPGSDPAAPTAGAPSGTGSSATEPGSTGPIEGPIPRPTPGGSGAGAIPAGLEEFYNQQLDWQSCIPFNTNPDLDEYFAAAGLDCANLIVPLDYADPSGPTVTTGVIRAAATGSDPEGSLQINPGGPGGSGVDFVAEVAGTKEYTTLQQHFDLVGFDTRGLGASRPQVKCQTDAQRDADRASNDRTTTPEGIAAINRSTTDYVAGCLSLTGGDAGIDAAAFLVTLGTETTVKDMDVLRSALGDTKLTYLGYSYGTLLGTVYADQFADNVRGMALDGVFDADGDAGQVELGQAAGFQGTFDAFATWCAQQQSCALGAEAGQATEQFQKLTRALLDTPLPLTDGRSLTFGDAITGTVQALYSETYWPTLRQALTNLSNGDGYLLMALADFYDERDSEGHYSNTIDVFNAVGCMDLPRTAASGESAEVLQQIAAAAPFRTSGDPIVSTPGVCSTWPGDRTLDSTATPPADLPELVVISTTGDPATPYENGVSLADELGADLITVNGDSHTAYLSGISCVDDPVTDYLVDLDLPKEGLTCP